MFSHPGAALCGQNPDVKRKALSLCPFVASLKKYLWRLILYIIFHAFLHVYSPGAEADNPWGQNFYVNINLLSLWSFAVSFFD